jgi:hypothetical protein
MTNSNFLAALKSKATEIQDSRESSEEKESYTDKIHRIDAEKAMKALEVVAQLGITNAGDPAVELMFDGPIPVALSERLKSYRFGYSPKFRVWRALATDDTVAVARELATRDYTGPYDSEVSTHAELSPAEADSLDKLDDLDDLMSTEEIKSAVKKTEEITLLAEYKEAVDLLAKVWDCDITDAMMKAVILTAQTVN